jgi:hypothetical protein
MIRSPRYLPGDLFHDTSRPLATGVTVRSKGTEPSAERGVALGIRTDAQCKAIREQLVRLVANPFFQHSKRYPNLLRYVVERALDGHAGELKERTLGIEVFGRAPDYDTSLDPVVRTTAGEIRKRIAQYYHEAGHDAEIRIELPSGSYIPEFHFPIVEPPGATAPKPERATSRRTKGLFAGAGVMLLIAGLWLHSMSPRSVVDKFWTSVIESSNPVLLCVGQRPNPRLSPTESRDSAAASDQLLTPEGSQNVSISDLITVAGIAGVLQARGKSYRIRGESATSFADLRDGAVVLIGAFNNDWTIRLTGPQRFSFEQSANTRWIKDGERPNRRDWAVDLSTPNIKLTDDYALISRAQDPTTDRIVVVAAGLKKYGTMAAGEFLTNNEYLRAITNAAPNNWEHKNLQVVLATKVISGNSGPPRVVATYFW